MTATLVCWHCGLKKEVVTPGPLQFAYELKVLADDNGWVGAFDINRARVLAFCCKEHMLAEVTKKGVFRFRAKGPKEVRDGVETS